MAKDKFADFDATAGNNTDIGGIAIQGTNIVSNFDNAFRELMSQIADNFASATVASSSTVDLGAQSAHYINITGTTTITAFGTIKAGTLKLVKFAAALTLTHNATSLILPGAASITTAAGDTAVFVSEGSGNWRCLQYNRSTASSVDGGILAGFRNKIINGDFDIWQRGTSFTASGYTADRWGVDIVSPAVGTTSRQTFTLGQTDVPGNPKYFIRHERTTAAGSDNKVFGQRIEGVRTFAGKKVTVTVYLKAGSAKDFEIDLVQNFGSGGTPSSSVSVTAQTFSVTTSWQRGNGGQSFTFDIPSISGKTLGSNGDDFLELRVKESASFSTFTLDMSHVSIVEGDATNEVDPFSPRHIQQEENLCLRYYAKDIIIRHKVGQNQTGAAYYITTVALPTRMRATPTLTTSGEQVFTSSTSSTTAASGSLTVTVSANANYIRADGNYSGVGDTSGFNCTIEASAEL